MLTPVAATDWAAIDRVTRRVGAMADNTAVCSSSIGRALGSGIACVSSLCHVSTWAVCSVAGSTAPSRAVVLAPAGLAGKGRVVEAVEGGGSSAVDEGCGADERDVVDYSSCQYDDVQV